MANENLNPITYADWAKTRDPDGSTADIVELLAQTNPIIEDAVVREGNTTTGHRTTVRTGYGQSTWRQLNYGVQPSKTTSKQVDDQAGMLEDYIEVDKALADLENDKAAFMLSESRGTMEEMGQNHANTLFYGDLATTPERFLGLTPRYSDPASAVGRNIIDHGGPTPAADSSSSMWFVTWGLDTTFEFFPKGSMVGLQMRDLGEVTLYDENGGRYQGYRTHLKHDVGLVVRDWRFNCRVPNLGSADIAADSIDLISAMTKAYNNIQRRGVGSTVIYANRQVLSSLDILAQNVGNAYATQLQMREWHGMDVLSYRGIPIRLCEALDVSDEAEVVFP